MNDPQAWPSEQRNAQLNFAHSDRNQVFSEFEGDDEQAAPKAGISNGRESGILHVAPGRSFTESRSPWIVHLNPARHAASAEFPFSSLVPLLLTVGVAVKHYNWANGA